MFRRKLFVYLLLIWIMISTSCGPNTTDATPSTDADMPNPASVFCEEQGYQTEIITAEDGSQSGACIFPDGSSCDEWAFFRGECGPGEPIDPPIEPPIDSPGDPAAIPTALPIDPADYQGWWTYTHSEYNFSIMLPEDWNVEEVTTGDPLMNGHLLYLRPEYGDQMESIRMTFRWVGDETLLWPTGVGQGEFIEQGTLDVSGEPVRRVLLVCPSGEVTSIWYHPMEGQPNITRGDIEFGFIFSASSHCEGGYSLGGKVQRVGEMIIASLEVP